MSGRTRIESTPGDGGSPGATGNVADGCTRPPKTASDEQQVYSAVAAAEPPAAVTSAPRATGTRSSRRGPRRAVSANIFRIG